MRFEEQSSTNIQEMLTPIKLAMQRYWGIAWAPALVVFLLVAVLSVKLPNYYASDVLIFIQPPKISTELFQKQTQSDKQEETERLEALVQEIMSRPRLRKVIQQFDLYPEYTGIIGKEKALRRFRGDISIEPIISPSGKALTQTFRIEYSHQDPKQAFEVTKALSNLFIEESVINQRDATQSTEEFLDAQLRKARKRLEDTEAKVQAFVRENFGKLPEHLDQAISRLQNARAQLATNSQVISANAARIGNLERELKLTARETAMTPDAAGVDTSDPRMALAQLERALAVYRSKYSDKHPDVLNTKKRIKLLKQQVSSGGSGGSGSARLGSSPEVRTLRREMNELQVQTEAMKVENENIKQMIKRLESNINEMPLREQELIAIKRDYANVKENYQKLLEARQKAELEGSMVRGQKGTQFKIVDPASLPVIPSGPNRWLIAGVGTVVSVLLFLLIPVGLHFLNDSFKFRDEVEKELELEVLGIIPPMKTPTARALARRANSTSMIASVVALLGGSALILLAV